MLWWEYSSDAPMSIYCLGMGGKKSIAAKFSSDVRDIDPLAGWMLQRHRINLCSSNHKYILNVHRKEFVQGLIQT